MICMQKAEMMIASTHSLRRRRILIGSKNNFFEKCIKYFQLYSQCVIMFSLGLKVGKRMMIYEY